MYKGLKVKEEHETRLHQCVGDENIITFSYVFVVRVRHIRKQDVS